MSTPRLYNTEAIVLRKMDLGEADCLLTLFTPHLGKLKAVARGARKTRSRLGGNTELLMHSQMLLAKARSLDTISQSQALEGFLEVRADLQRTSCALYVAELVDKFTAEAEEAFPLYRLLLETLRALGPAPRLEPVLRYFELHMFIHLGYRPELQRCVVCHSVLAQVDSYFTPDGGGVLCNRCRDHTLTVVPLSVNALKVLRFLQRSSLHEAARLKMPAAISEEVKHILRRYIRYLLERDVNTAEWLDRLDREGAGRT